MKKFFKILGITIGIIIVLLILLPVIFKGQLIDFARKQINNRLNATVTFTGGHVSLLRSFPLVTMKLDTFVIAGKDRFADDTLINAPSLTLAFNLISLFGDQYEIVKIRMEDPVILLRVTQEGLVNWDILKEDEAPGEALEAVAGKEDTSSYVLELRNVDLLRAHLTYRDESVDMVIMADRMWLMLSGDYAQDQTNITASAKMEELSIAYADLPILQKVTADLSTVIHADFINEKYTFSQSNVILNEIPITIEGYWAEPEDQVEVDLRFKTGKSDFKGFLSLIPAIYAKDFDQIRTSGNLEMDGFILGKYTEESLPSFGLKMKITGGMFQYPDLPANVSDIRLEASLDNPGGTMDNTVISVDPLHLAVAGNPVDASLSVRQPVSDPDIQATVKGKIDLGAVQKVFPLDPHQQLSGRVSADITIKGRMSDFEQKNFQKVIANGTLDADGVVIRLSSASQPVGIDKALLEVRPEKIQVADLAVNYGSSDLHAQGYLENYIPYLLDGKVLSGQFSTTSQFIDLDSLLTDLAPSTPDSRASIPDTGALTLKVPSNLDLSLQVGCDRLNYNAITVDHAGGRIMIQDSELKIRDLKMDLLGGSIALDGLYSARDTDLAGVQLSLKLLGFDVQQAYNSLQMIHTFAPIAQKTKGSFSAGLSLSAGLNKRLRPVLGSLSSTGNLASSRIVIEDVQVFNQIAETLKIEKLKNATIDALNFSFEILEGKAHVRQFPFTMGSIHATLSGYTSLDQQINFILALEIPRSEFGSHFNEVMDNLTSQIQKTDLDLKMVDQVNVDVVIGGTITRPTINIGLKEAMVNVVDEIKAQVEEELQEKKEEAEARLREETEKTIARVDAQAQLLIQEAEKKAFEIKSLARQSADKIRMEADSAAVRMVEEGKKKGKVAEVAATAAAAQLKKEADKQADALIAEADQRADAIIREARDKADRMKQEVRTKFGLTD
ncbi:MAG: AsmA-like C-terminal region-containing protein [Bacteroidales bacterium]|nr:AsmA family protein [Lentimicrobiaceae bacterium]MDD5693941.1 AsmA-like C-terminal region-containing protein [Bacteroidales bacterium]